ncbi:MAG: hypothetical protein IMX01_06905 [Limnochordaceae bacterium]|nr:hypothetical protein [Limnochordaceae bacterium]
MSGWHGRVRRVLSRGMLGVQDCAWPVAGAWAWAFTWVWVCIGVLSPAVTLAATALTPAAGVAPGQAAMALFVSYRVELTELTREQALELGVAPSLHTYQVSANDGGDGWTLLATPGGFVLPLGQAGGTTTTQVSSRTAVARLFTQIGTPCSLEVVHQRLVQSVQNAGTPGAGPGPAYPAPLQWETSGIRLVLTPLQWVLGADGNYLLSRAAVELSGVAAGQASRLDTEVQLPAGRRMVVALVVQPHKARQASLSGTSIGGTATSGDRYFLLALVAEPASELSSTVVQPSGGGGAAFERLLWPETVSPAPGSGSEEERAGWVWQGGLSLSRVLSSADAEAAPTRDAVWSVWGERLLQPLGLGASVKLLWRGHGMGVVSAGLTDRVQWHATPPAAAVWSEVSFHPIAYELPSGRRLPWYGELNLGAAYGPWWAEGQAQVWKPGQPEGSTQVITSLGLSRSLSAAWAVEVTYEREWWSGQGLWRMGLRWSWPVGGR